VASSLIRIPKLLIGVLSMGKILKISLILRSYPDSLFGFLFLGSKGDQKCTIGHAKPFFLVYFTTQEISKPMTILSSL